MQIKLCVMHDLHLTVSYNLQKNWECVLRDCTAALELNERYVKALQRRAKACEVLKDLEQALEDLTAVCIIESFQNQATLVNVDRVLKELGMSWQKHFRRDYQKCIVWIAVQGKVKQCRIRKYIVQWQSGELATTDKQFCRCHVLLSWWNLKKFIFASLSFATNSYYYLGIKTCDIIIITITYILGAIKLAKSYVVACTSICLWWFY